MGELFITSISIGPGGSLEFWGNLENETDQTLSEDDLITETVAPVNSTTLYGAIDPDDREIYRAKVTEKIKIENAYTHYR